MTPRPPRYGRDGSNLGVKTQANRFQVRSGILGSEVVDYDGRTMVVLDYESEATEVAYQLNRAAAAGPQALELAFTTLGWL